MNYSNNTIILQICFLFFYNINFFIYICSQNIIIYNIYINNSNTVYKSEEANTFSTSIPISEFNGDIANVKVEGKKQYYEAV